MNLQAEFVSRPSGRAKAGLRWLLLLLALAWAIRFWVWMPTLTVGESMLPALAPGHLAGVNRAAYWFHPPQRGDIVVFWNGKEFFSKRIIALPGDVLAVTNGTVYISSRRLPERYVIFPDHSNVAESQIPLGRYLVAGDNRGDSLFALVRRDRIVGRLRSLAAGNVSGETPDPPH